MEAQDLDQRRSDGAENAQIEAEEAIIVAFRKHTLLPLDDCFYAPQPPGPPAVPELPACAGDIDPSSHAAP